MFERYTERARRVLFFARYEASQLGSISIETEHLLLGLIREGKGLTSRIFARSHLSLENIRKEVEGRTVFREKVSTSVEIPFSAETRRVLQFAAEEADRLLHNYIRDGASAARHSARGAVRGVGHPVGEGDAAEHGPRGHRAVAEREDDGDARQGDAAAGRVQPPTCRTRRRRTASTRSSAAAPRSSASCRCSAAAPRTTRSSLASRASARPPSSKDSRSGSPAATCRTFWPTSGCWPSTSRSSWRAPSTAGSSRSA